MLKKLLERMPGTKFALNTPSGFVKNIIKFCQQIKGGKMLTRGLKWFVKFYK